ncbi:MAG TPA: hypothetical protein VFQ61_39080 [Polyangiaceae bacterium]|nr:hypothetical protein [Polyangiaceae bacterium]
MSPPDALLEQIVSVARGELTHVYRVRLLADGTASMERYENGAFTSPRIFTGAEHDGSFGGARAGDDGASPEKRLERAVRYAVTYLDGSVNVGERDLLSPTSALTRNVRWFPGDIQMLNTAFHYVLELFPSAQFHVTQLFRRVFGDIAFLALILLTSTFWLRTQASTTAKQVALLLQVLSMVAIIGFDRFWEPIRYRVRKLSEVRWTGRGARVVIELPWIVVSQVAAGVVGVTVNTLIGLTNLVINPFKIFLSWRQVGRGKTLEWKASSTSAGQDMRGWPLAEFLDVYGPAARFGLYTLACLLVLVSLGAPLDLLGLNSFGVFLASFLTAWLYAWYAALPRRIDDGAPQYQLAPREFWSLTIAGFAGLGLSAALFALGLYPAPAFEKSAGWVALFLTATSAFAALYPTYYRYKHRAYSISSERARSRLSRLNAALALVAVAVLAAALVLPRPLLPEAGERLRDFVLADGARFRIPEVERRVYSTVAAAIKQTRNADPEPLLRSEGDQVTLAQIRPTPSLDVAELQGIPEPRPPKLARLDSLRLPEVIGLPVGARIPTNKPRREAVLPSAAPNKPLSQPRAASQQTVQEARERFRLAEARKLASGEQAAQRAFLDAASYPWISREELERLGAIDERGAGVALPELARVYRFEDVKALWDRVPAVTSRKLSPRARFTMLLEGVDGAVSLGLDPSAENVQRFLATESEIAERWPIDYPNVPLTSLPGRATEAVSRVFGFARLALQSELSPRELASRWRLDYVNTHWNTAAIGPTLREVYRKRPTTDPWDNFQLDFGGNDELRARWEGLQTEQVVASAALGPSAAQLPVEHLTLAAKLLNAAAAASDSPPGDSTTPAGSDLVQAALQELAVPEGTDRVRLASGDATASALSARLRTQILSARIGELAKAVAGGRALPGSTEDHQLLLEAAELRFGAQGASAEQRTLLQWLLLIDASETYKEIAAGYDRYQRENAIRGIKSDALARAPELDDEQVWRDLMYLWRELPQRFPHLPIRADLVGEFVCQTAYLSSRNARDPRGTHEFIEDFSDVFESVDALMATAPPAALQRFADVSFEKTQGRTSKSAQARRFFAWWQAAGLARAVVYNRQQHGAAKVNPVKTSPLATPAKEVEEVARDWAGILEGGRVRYPHLPWDSAGFSEFFTTILELEGWTLPELWQHFDGKLARAERMIAAHVAAFQSFEELVDRRIAEKTNAPSLDRRLREANAVLALIDLLSALESNGVRSYTNNPTRLSRDFSALYDSLAKRYPNLYWPAEGAVEAYFLRQVIEGWDEYETREHFAPELALADTLAAHGLRERFERIASEDASRLSAADRALRTFIDVQAQRVEKKSGSRITQPRARAFNALVATATLLMSAAQEGLLALSPSSGAPVEKTPSHASVQAWARRVSGTAQTRTLVPFAESLVRDFGELHAAMRGEGPAFPWEDGAVLETELFVLRKSGKELQSALPALSPTWKTASDYIRRQVSLPESFTQLVTRDAREELRSKLARELGVTAGEIPDPELARREDPEVFGLNALLVLSNIASQIHVAYHEEPNPSELAQALVEIRREGPKRYPHLPWAAKGFVPSLIIGAWRPELARDFWRYAALIDLASADTLLAEASKLSSNPSVPAPGCEGSKQAIPCEVYADMRTIMREQTGRTPASDEVVAFQILKDASALLKEFFPAVPVNFQSALALARVRTRLRSLDSEFPQLHILKTDDQTTRVGYAERLTAISAKLAIEAGISLADPRFDELAVHKLQDKYLLSMSRIYDLVRHSFLPGELEYFAQSIVAESVEENAKRAARHGLPASALSVPEVKSEDVVSDFALYELLYAEEIGQDRDYVVSLLTIFDQLRSRPDIRAAHERAMRDIDRAFEGDMRQPTHPDYTAWLASEAHREWQSQRGWLYKRSRGKLLALARSFALLQREAFSDRSAPDARAAFARFGSFNQFMTRFFDNSAAVHRVPELHAALQRLEQEDAFLADGVEFAIAIFKSHVLDAIYPGAERSFAALAGISRQLPQVQADYRHLLGFTPGLESGVPFYDSFDSWLRRRVEHGDGTDLFRRLNMVQRSLQSWPNSFVLKRAYKVLFDRDLDEEDPTPVARSGKYDLLPKTVGSEVKDFLESRLPEALLRETGSRDPAAWLAWLMQHGEIELDGSRASTNAYLDTVQGYQQRLAEYQKRIEQNGARGRPARAELQRHLDIEREYRSFRAQVEALERTARRVPSLVSAAGRDYTLAIRQATVWIALLVLSLVLGWRWSSKRLLGFVMRKGALALTLSLAAVPLAVALSPAHSAEFAGGTLRAIGLLGPATCAGAELPCVAPRGAAAQLLKIRPWTPLLGGQGSQGGFE